MIEFFCAIGFGFCIGVCIPNVITLYESTIHHSISMNNSDEHCDENIYMLCRLKNEIESEEKKSLDKSLTY